MAFIGDLLKEADGNFFKVDFKDAYFIVQEVMPNPTNTEEYFAFIRAWGSEYARHNCGLAVYRRKFIIPTAWFVGINDIGLGERKKLVYQYLKGQKAFSDMSDHFDDYTGPVDFTEMVAKDNLSTADDIKTQIEHL